MNETRETRETRETNILYRRPLFYCFIVYYVTILFLQGFHCFIICLLSHCSFFGFDCSIFCLLRNYTISSRFSLFRNLSVTSLLCSRLRLSPLLFVASNYIFKFPLFHYLFVT